jgi:hypothetical protein
MKFKILLIVSVVVSSIAFYLIGHSYGEKKQVEIEKNYSIEDLRQKLKDKEASQILNLVSNNLEIVEQKKYAYFDKYNEYYCVGYIKNLANILICKDITFEIKYFTKTKTLLKSDTIKKFEYIYPMDSLLISEKIDLPEFAEDFEINVISTDFE